MKLNVYSVGEYNKMYHFIHVYINSMYIVQTSDSGQSNSSHEKIVSVSITRNGTLHTLKTGGPGT